MPSTIPYDSSLDLGNIVPQDHLDNLEAISALQSPVDAAQGELNQAITLKRKLGMTENELANLGIDTADVKVQITEVDKAVVTAAKSYSDIAVKNLPAIATARGKLPQISHHIESPIDYNKSQIKQLPLAADSLTMDCQYFSFDETTQRSCLLYTSPSPRD